MTSKAIRVLASPLPLIHSSPAPVASLNFSKQGKHIPAPGPLHCLLPGMPFPQISAWLSLPSRLCSHVSLSVRSFLIPLPKKHLLTFSMPLCCCTVFVVFASSWHVLKVFVYAQTNEVSRVPSVMEWQVCEVTCAFHSCTPASHPRAILGGVHAPLTATFSRGPVVSTLGLWWEGAIFFFWVPRTACGILVLCQRLNRGPLQWNAEPWALHSQRIPFLAILDHMSFFILKFSALSPRPGT